VPGVESDDGSWDGTGWSDIPGYIEGPDPTQVNSNNLVTDESALKLTDPEGHPLLQFDRLSSGTGIRFTLSWNNCPGDGSRVPAMDYDVAMCGIKVDESSGDSTQTCKAYSQSMHDTDEGFEVKIKDGFHWDDVTIWSLRNKGDAGCNGSPEPAHWAAVWGGI
jgi:hypothetical protein